MRPGEASGQAVRRLSYASAFLATAIVVVGAVLYERQSREAFRQAARADVSSDLARVRADLEGALFGCLQLTQGLVGVMRFDPDMDPASFARLGSAVIDGQHTVRAVAAAPGSVISMIYPLEGNEALLGLDYQRMPAQSVAARMVRTLPATIISGPNDLQGRRGFVAWAPVFLDSPDGGKRLWGLVATVIDEEALYREAGLLDPDLPISLALVGDDGRLDLHRPFFGDDSVLTADPVIVEVPLPLGTWQIAAIPRGGWTPMPGVWKLRGMFALAAVLLVGPIIGGARLLAARQAQIAVVQAREVELARLTWRLEFALAGSKVGVWEVELETDTLFWDDRTKAIFGFDRDAGALEAQHWARALHPEDRARAEAEAKAAVLSRGNLVSEYRIVRPDGAVRHIRDMAGYYESEFGGPRLVGLVWDVTRDVEQKIELDLRRIEAEAATVAKSQFLAAMSHEIRTPMNGVLGMLELMLASPLSRPQFDRARVAQASAQSLLGILNDILDFSKLEAAMLRVSAEPLDIRALLRDVVDLMAAGAMEKRLSLVSAVAEAVPARILSDPIRLRQILTNLISNALKFTDAGEIRVTVDYASGPEDDTLLVEVRDTGIGIAPDLCGRIFQQFVQADNSLTGRSGGTGLGLAICKQLVELMGGSILLESAVGVGSSFRFTARTRAAAPAQPADPPAVPDPGTGAAPPPMRILLAEHNATTRHLITAYLVRAGHSVTSVENGAEAIEAARSGRFDAILMDMRMSQVDGVAATRAIRELPGGAGAVPIIALSASTLPDERDRAFAAGMIGYLVKPVASRALLAALQDAAAPDPRIAPQQSANA